MLSTKKLLLVFLPAIALVAITFAIRIIQYEPINKKPDEKSTAAGLHIPISPQDPILGDKKAPHTLIVFEDLGCEQCRAQETLFQAIEEKHPGALKIVWKSLSVTRFPYYTKPAHVVAYCAHNQGKFAAFKTAAFANSGNLSPGVLEIIAQDVGLDMDELAACQQSGAPEQYLQSVEELARALDIQAVPAMFLNDVQIRPPQLLEEWEALLGLTS